MRFQRLEELAPQSRSEWTVGKKIISIFVWFCGTQEFCLFTHEHVLEPRLCCTWCHSIHERFRMHRSPALYHWPCHPGRCLINICWMNARIGLWVRNPTMTIHQCVGLIDKKASWEVFCPTVIDENMVSDSLSWGILGRGKNKLTKRDGIKPEAMRQQKGWIAEARRQRRAEESVMGYVVCHYHQEPLE